MTQTSERRKGVQEKKGWTTIRERGAGKGGGGKRGQGVWETDGWLQDSKTS